jgi:hypothetical protein
MEWYYAQGTNKVGPLSATQVEEFIRAGTVTPNTLVWRTGMAQWEPCRVAWPAAAGSGGAPGGGVRCAECGKLFPASEVISLSGFSVCAACKPLFLQKLQEGMRPGGMAAIWRSGKLLVTGVKTTLPDFCVKCNAPSQGDRLRRKLYWHHPAIYLLIIVSILIYAIVALLVRKRADLEVGLCERHHAKRRRDILLSWLLGFLGVGLIVAAVIQSNGLMGFAGAVVLIGALIYAAITTPIVSAQRIDGEYVWVRGVCREYLSALPEWWDKK